MAEITDAHGETGFSSASDDGLGRGLKILTLVACTLLKITKINTTTATTAYLREGADPTNILAQASFSGDDATFDFELDNDTSYYVTVDSGGSTYTQNYKDGASYPYVGTNVNFTAGISDDPWNEYGGRLYTIKSVTTDAGAAGGAATTQIAIIG